MKLARDRVALLLDQDSPFLELGAFTGFDNEDSTPCGNLISGIGNICGRVCLLMSHIPTQSGGAWNEMTGMKKHNKHTHAIADTVIVLKVNRMMEIAFENDLPLVSLVQSVSNALNSPFKMYISH